MRPIPLVLIWVLSSVLAASFSPMGTADEPKQNALTAKQILDRMAKTYAECKSYRDSGLVKTVFIQADGKRTVEKRFTTAFVRPDRFRFEFTEQSGNKNYRYIIWRKEKVVQTWWDIRPGIEKPESLVFALGAAVGVSGSSSTTVPALFLPDKVGGSLTVLTEAKRIEDAKLDKADCFRVQGKFVASLMTVWIDKKTFLVRGIDTQNQFDNFRTEDTTTYDPMIDGEITDKMLEFDPPKQK
jgi:outer membrane lipoprotein-sorting protein